MFDKKHFYTIDSTHKWAQNLDPASLIKPLMVTADMQTASIGRRAGTSWHAPPKTSLIATFILPQFKSSESHNLAQLLTCSLATVLHTLSFFPLFKWPNDLLLSQKKLAGAMADIQNSTAIISCAMNINTSKEDLEKVDIPATSLKNETNRNFDIPSLADKLSLQFTSDLTRLQKEGFSSFSKEMNNYLAFKDQIVTIKDAPIQNGIVKSVAPDGRLVIESHGKEHFLTKGSLQENY